MVAEREESPSGLSYVTAAVSGALVLALVVYLAVHAFRADRPPMIVTKVVPAEHWTRQGTNYLPIDVENLGDLPASQVVIETRTPGAAAMETATIDYLAGGERQRVYITASRDADPSVVSARVVSFQEP